MDRHTCDDEDKSCCVNAMYRSPQPQHYDYLEQSRRSKFLKAGGLKIEVGINSNVIAVLCRNYTPEQDSSRLHARIARSIMYEKGLELRVFDLDLNIIKTIQWPFQSMTVAPSLLNPPYTHDYEYQGFDTFRGKYYLFQCYNSGSTDISYYNTELKIVLRKETGHSDHVECVRILGENRFITCSTDGQIKFWDFP